MKLHSKNKGKVHPSPLSPSTTTATTTTTKDPSSALKLLPAAIFALISVLSLEDQEVLAYMITRSLETTANPSHLLLDNRPRRQRRAKQGLAAAPPPHTPPVFQCGCFDCYTSYWFRWDSSLNRELIHQAIEAFEDHLTSGESEQSRKRGGRGRRKSEKKLVPLNAGSECLTTPEITVEEIGVVSPLPVADLPESVEEEEAAEAPLEVEAVDSAEEEEEEEAVVVVVAGGNHKGLARKVLPDVIGLFNSRLWSLWSPNA